MGGHRVVGNQMLLRVPIPLSTNVFLTATIMEEAFVKDTGRYGAFFVDVQHRCSFEY